MASPAITAMSSPISLRLIFSPPWSDTIIDRPLSLVNLHGGVFRSFLPRVFGALFHDSLGASCPRTCTQMPPHPVRARATPFSLSLQEGALSSASNPCPNVPPLPIPPRAQLDIREVLNRRTDLSTFVVHLTRNRPGQTAKEALESIIAQRLLRAGEPRGWALGAPGINLTEGMRATQRVVCFSETPLEHAYALFADIAYREVQLHGYGVAFTKMIARKMGCNPVWYVEFTPGGARAIANALNNLVEAAARNQPTFDDIWKVTPFIEGMGTWTDGLGQLHRREFWWEREWRHLGDLPLGPWWEKALWLCPEEEIEEFEARLGPRRCIDPRWSLEQIIGHLHGLSQEDMTPFWPR
jgi:Putative abortive phage resistance protein AbiGi, antitoxin